MEPVVDDNVYKKTWACDCYKNQVRGKDKITNRVYHNETESLL